MKVGVFNVLANGVFHCGKLYDKNPTEEQKTELFEEFKKAASELTGVAPENYDTNKNAIVYADSLKNVRTNYLYVPAVVNEKINETNNQQNYDQAKFNTLKNLFDILRNILSKGDQTSNTSTSYIANFLNETPKTKWGKKDITFNEKETDYNICEQYLGEFNKPTYTKPKKNCASLLKQLSEDFGTGLFGGFEIEQIFLM